MVTFPYIRVGKGNEMEENTRKLLEFDNILIL